MSTVPEHVGENLIATFTAPSTIFSGGILVEDTAERYPIANGDPDPIDKNGEENSFIDISEELCSYNLS
jgi:hypothetical protein